MEWCGDICNRISCGGLNPIDVSAIISTVLLGILAVLWDKEYVDLEHHFLNLCDTTTHEKCSPDTVPSKVLEIFAVTLPILALTVTHCLPRYSGSLGGSAQRLTADFFRGFLFYLFGATINAGLTNIFKVRRFAFDTFRFTFHS